MSFADRFRDDDDEDEVLDNLAAENRYCSRPVFKTWRFLNSGEVKFVDVNNVDSSWIKTDSKHVVELTEER